MKKQSGAKFFKIFNASLFFLLGVTYTSLASVSIKNGNFFVGYIDIHYSGGFEPKIERVYNSKTNFKGMFGWGWGTEYESHLTVSADGSVVMHEYGGGSDNRFLPLNFTENDLSASVEMIVAGAKKTGLLGTTAHLNVYKSRLLSDSDFRNDEWEKFCLQGKLKARVLGVGTKLFSSRFSYQHIIKTAEGYLREYETGKSEAFDENGHLIKILDKNKNFITFIYGKDGHLAKVLDNFNRKIFFSFNERGLVSEIEGESGKKIQYRYNGNDELIFSKDVDSNTYEYAYDLKGRHNLTQVKYTDNTTMQVSYYEKDHFENVKSVKDRDGSMLEYTYKRQDSANFGAKVLEKDPQGKTIGTSEYLYETKKRGDGEDWTSKMTTVFDGDKTETSYHEKTGLPLRIRHGSEETVFQYDERGHMLKKVSPTEVTELTYDSSVGKISKVVVTPKKNPEKRRWSEFQYDTKGNLIFAKNSEGKTVKLLVDRTGRISTMVDQNRHKISFKYNENSKPIEIIDPTLGSIHVTYNNSGEIKKVDSPAGRKIAAEVSNTFQNLMEIIKPAGVSLSL